MSSELSDELVPFFAFVGFYGSSDEIRQKVVDSEYVNREFVSLAFSSGVSYTHVRLKCGLCNMIVSS